MNEEHGEVLSAWVDGEVAPAELLRQALAQPGALALLDELLAVRAMVETRAEPREAAIESTRVAMGRSRKHRRHLAPQLRWAIAAVVLLAVGATFGLMVGRDDRGPVKEGLRAPQADLVAQFPFE